MTIAGRRDAYPENLVFTESP